MMQVFDAKTAKFYGLCNPFVYAKATIIIFKCRIYSKKHPGAFKCWMFRDGHLIEGSRVLKYFTRLICH